MSVYIPPTNSVIQVGVRVLCVSLLLGLFWTPKRIQSTSPWCSYLQKEYTRNNNNKMASANIPLHIQKSVFDHIKLGGPCPFRDGSIAQLIPNSEFEMDDGRMSVMLGLFLDAYLGTEEIVSNRRKIVAFQEFVMSTATSSKGVLRFNAGSYGEGLRMISSDTDKMYIDLNVTVSYPDQLHAILPNNAHKTILLMKNADCRPGYVTLELSQTGKSIHLVLASAIVPVCESMFVSSDMYRQGIVDGFNGLDGAENVSNGPCSTSNIDGTNMDIAPAIPCVSWPREADEWVHRTRLHGWPTPTMIDKILQGGCHLVPVGDKCSTDTFLQWRISFACAERLLIQSLTHPQFRVYGLLKCFLVQIKDLLYNIIGDNDIICSYFLKNMIFHAVENSPSNLWEENNLFICFRFCLSVLIAWVKSGYCPNYFIQTNNLFLRKVHGENRQKLLHLLTDVYDLKWMSLSVESVKLPKIGVFLQQPMQQAIYLLRSNTETECASDVHLFGESGVRDSPNCNLRCTLELLQASHSDTEEFIAYHIILGTLDTISRLYFKEYNKTSSNKQKYKFLKQSKHLIAPYASVCTSPGLMYLATFHYLTGSYRKSLEMCADVTSSFKLFICDNVQRESIERYQRLYCGHGYSLFHKFKKGCSLPLTFFKHNIETCLPHLHFEVTKNHGGVQIPPLPYATFLSLLCYHDLGDLRRRDTELINLRALNYHREQGGHSYWIVHTLLGICYQLVGDKSRAIRSFTDSLSVMPYPNPAQERIDSLRSS